MVSLSTGEAVDGGVLGFDQGRASHPQDLRHTHLTVVLTALSRRGPLVAIRQRDPDADAGKARLPRCCGS